MGIKRRVVIHLKIRRTLEVKENRREKPKVNPSPLKGLPKGRRCRGEDQQSDYQRILCKSSSAKWIMVSFQFSIVLALKFSSSIYKICGIKWSMHLGIDFVIEISKEYILISRPKSYNHI